MMKSLFLLSVLIGSLSSALSKESFASFFTPKKEALEVSKRLNTNDLRNECCKYSPCNFEERAEFAEKNGHDWVSKNLCEVSITEADRTCRCKARAGYMYECGIGRCPPCQRNDIYCGGSWSDKGNCVSQAKKCDSDADCPDGRDEAGCKFSAGLKTSIVRGDYTGVECLYSPDSKGKKFRGKKSVTKDGLTCQAWSSQARHKHDFKNPDNYNKYRQEGITSNFCRDPDSTGAPWCYTTSSTRWQYCNIPKCNFCMLYGYCGQVANPRKWFCAVRQRQGVVGKAFTIGLARTALGSKGLGGNPGNRQAIIPMTGNIAGDPHTLSKSWSGGSMYWDNWNDIRVMQRMCSQVSVPKAPSGASHYGNVMIGERPVCQNHWDDNDARVVCRQLNYGVQTVAVATYNSAFGKVTSNPIAHKFACKGTEADLRTCGHSTQIIWNSGCNSGKAAGVVCIDLSKLDVVGGPLRGGNVVIAGYPVGHVNWDRKDAQVVCNMRYGDEFPLRDKKVPVFEATTGSAFGAATTDEIIMDRVECTGKETSLSQCKFVTHDKETSNRAQVAGVKCAKCNIQDLLKIIGTVKIESTVTETRNTIDEAFTQLKSKCYNWDCSAAIPIYPEYCEVYAFLQNAKYMVAEKRKDAIVHATFNAGRYIEFQMANERQNRILTLIRSVSKQTASFQRQVAGYFDTMAKFDRDRAQADYADTENEWGVQRSTISAIQYELGPQLKKLFDYAFAAQGMEIRYRASQLALALASLASPVDAVLNPGEMADKASNIYEKTAELADSVAEMANLGYTFHNTLPELKTLARDLVRNFKINQETYDRVAALVGIKDMASFTPALAKEFLEEYSNYSPAFSAKQLANYEYLIEAIVENACEVLTAEGGVIKAAIKLAATGLCPKIKQKVAILIGVLEEIKDTQLEVMDAFADFARAKVSEMAASDLSKVLGMGGLAEIRGAIAEKNGEVMYQIHKRTLIHNACDTIKYMEFGKETSYCKRLRDNTFGDLADLVAYKFNTDMCPNPTTGTFNIPAMIRRGNEPLPPGTLDLTTLMNENQTASSIMFQIPNTQWLVDNGWIDAYDADKGPFFVQELQLFPLPSFSSKPRRISSRFSLINNVVNNEAFVFDNKIESFFSYEENNRLCKSKRSEDSPYSMPACDKTNYCERTPGTFRGPVYPSLMALWKVDFDMPAEARLHMPYPTGLINLKVNAKFCYGGSSRSGKRKFETKSAGVCCAMQGQYTDGRGNCQACPKDSTPRLSGYFCESCPPGYTIESPGVKAYGCKPCPNNTFNSLGGTDSCSPCPAGTHTNGTVGNSFCING